MDAETTTAARRPGRQRSERARSAVLHAAAELLERDGWLALTMEGIAVHAGVSKATIYRWWPGKAAVLMDALLAATDPSTDFPDTGDALEDVRLQLRTVITLFTDTAPGRLLLSLIAESAHDPDLAAALRERLIASRRADATGVLDRGRRRGELRGDLDTGIAIDAIYGAVYYRLLVSREPTTPDYADALLAELAPVLRPASRSIR